MRQDVEQAIRIVLGTDWGERVMRPDFGAGLKSFVFGPLNQTTLRMVQTRVQDSLIKWEPRIDVEQVKVTLDSSELNKLLIAITYRVRVTNTVHNLVYRLLSEGRCGPVIPTKSPFIDERDASAVFEEFEQRRPGYLPAWNPPEKSAGAALGQVFARFVEAVLQRLNQAPARISSPSSISWVSG